MSTLIFWVGIAVLITTPFAIKRINTSITSLDTILKSGAFAKSADMTVAVAVKKDRLSMIRLIGWYMFAMLAIELIFMQPFVRITPQLIFVACVVFAFCAYICEKIIQRKITKNVERSTNHVAEALTDEKITLPNESLNMIKKNSRLYNWTTGLSVARFILLIVATFDYFWFM